MRDIVQSERRKSQRVLPSCNLFLSMIRTRSSARCEPCADLSAGSLQQRRLEAIKLSGLFGAWDPEDLMRLASMSRIHRHASKSVLLRQRKVSRKEQIKRSLNLHQAGLAVDRVLFR